MDIENALEEQDLLLARHVLQEGRILLLGFNKWDKVIKENRNKILQSIQNVIKNSISEVKNLFFFTLSAKNDQNLTQILDSALDLYDIWSSKISTKKLNDCKDDISDNISNIVGKVRMKIKYITQIKTKPPTFVIFCNINPKDIRNDTEIVIRNKICENFKMTSIPIRLFFRKSKNS
jgi:GTP-binding protein